MCRNVWLWIWWIEIWEWFINWSWRLIINLLTRFKYKPKDSKYYYNLENVRFLEIYSNRVWDENARNWKMRSLTLRIMVNIADTQYTCEWFLTQIKRTIMQFIYWNRNQMKVRICNRLHFSVTQSIFFHESWLHYSYWWAQTNHWCAQPADAFPRVNCIFYRFIFPIDCSSPIVYFLLKQSLFFVYSLFWDI